MDITQISLTQRPDAAILSRASGRTDGFRSLAQCVFGCSFHQSERLLNLLRTFCATRPMHHRLGDAEELAERFGVGKRTVRNAIRELEREGVIKVQKGRRGGAFVNKAPIERTAQQLCDHVTLTGIPLSDVKSATLFLLRIAVELICDDGEHCRPQALAAAQDLFRARELDHLYTDVDQWCTMRSRIVEAAGNPAICLLHDAFQVAYRDALAFELQEGAAVEAEAEALLRAEKWLLDKLVTRDRSEARRAIRLISRLEVRFFQKSLNAHHICRTLQPQNLYGCYSKVRKGGDKLAHQTLRALHADVRQKSMLDGARLGTLTELANAFGVGEDVMRETIALARHQGLVSVRRGRGGGVFVSPNNPVDAARATAHRLASICKPGDVNVIMRMLERSNVGTFSRELITSIIQKFTELNVKN